MEPAIPTGSLVYVRHEEPDTIVKDDVIAFYSNNADGSIITHRVVSNSPAMGQFITKGDANEEKDMNPIPYNNYIGKVKLSVRLSAVSHRLQPALPERLPPHPSSVLL